MLRQHADNILLDIFHLHISEQLKKNHYQLQSKSVYKTLQEVHQFLVPSLMRDPLLLRSVH